MSGMSTRRGASRRARIIGAAVATASLGLIVPPSAVAGAAAEVTYYEHIEPILARSCLQCHRPESVAPMSLRTYDEVRPWARAIKDRTGRVGKPDVMPPWYIEPDIGIQEFAGDISLSAAEIAAIAAWVDAGAPRGAPGDAPATTAVANSSGWRLGEPDLVLQSPGFEVLPNAPDWWGPLGAIETGLTEDRYVSSIEMREVSDFRGEPERDTSGGLYVVHHLIVIPVGPNGRPDPSAGFWPLHEVGRNPDVFHADSGKLLRAGSKILLPSIHLHAAGRLTRAHVEIGLTFHPPGYQPTRTVQHLGPGTRDLDIKPMEADQKFEAFTTLLENTKITVFEPHMHAAGVRMCLDAIWLGTIETLSCAGYNHNWVRVYTYAEDAAPLLPKGTILRITGYFDNTPSNPNVSDPRNWSGLGHRSIDNMMTNIGQGIFLDDAAFAEEMASRRSRLGLVPGQTVVGCPLCGYEADPGARAGTSGGGQ